MANTKPDDQRSEMQDYAFRQAMRAKEEESEEAGKWVALDNEASTLERKISSAEIKHEMRRDRIWPAEQALTEAREVRDSYREENQRPGFFEGGQKDWDTKYQALDNDVAARQKEFAEVLRKSTPEELAKLQSYIDDKRDRLMQKIEERQGIAKLPSETAQEMQDQQAGQASLDENARLPSQRDQGAGDGWRAQTQEQSLAPEQAPPAIKGDEQQELDQQGFDAKDEVAFVERLAKQRAQMEEQDGASSQGVVGHRLRPNFAGYATTVEEENNFKEQEANRQGAWRELGRAPTHDEVLKYESNLAAEQAAEASKNEPAQEVQGAQGKPGQVAGDLAERMAARREQQADAGKNNAVEQDQLQEVAPSKEAASKAEIVQDQEHAARLAPQPDTRVAQEPAVQQAPLPQREDLHAQVAQSNAPPLAERMAARREQQTQVSQQDDAQQPATKEPSKEEVMDATKSYLDERQANKTDWDKGRYTADDDRSNSGALSAWDKYDRDNSKARENLDGALDGLDDNKRAEFNQALNDYEKGNPYNAGQDPNEKQANLNSFMERAEDTLSQEAPNTQQGVGQEVQAEQAQEAPKMQAGAEQQKEDVQQDQAEKAPQQAEEEQGASTVAERQAKQAEQAEAKSEAKAEQGASKTHTRDWGDEDGMGM